MVTANLQMAGLELALSVRFSLSLHQRREAPVPAGSQGGSEIFPPLSDSIGNNGGCLWGMEGGNKHVFIYVHARLCIRGPPCSPPH
jgi:hypothetical protein